MNRADREMWQSARTLADLGELTAQWIEGSIGEQPGYCGPSDLDDPGRMVPLFASLCRSGFMTIQSQEACTGPGHDGAHWEQRAAVEGFATLDMATRLYSFAPPGMIVILHHPADRPRRKTSYRRAVTVTTRAGQPHTGFGAHLSSRFICDPHTGYGICRPDAIAALCSAWQVAVIDPQWGRPDLLRDTLATLAEPR